MMIRDAFTYWIDAEVVLIELPTSHFDVAAANSALDRLSVFGVDLSRHPLLLRTGTGAYMRVIASGEGIRRFCPLGRTSFAVARGIVLHLADSAAEFKTP